MVAPFDYSDLVTVADELITEFGRTVTLQLPAQGPADPAQVGGARASGNDITIANVAAAFLRPSVEDREATETQRATDRILVPASDLAGNTIDNRWRVLDGSTLFEVVVARPIQPGPTLVYVELLVAR